MIMQVLMMCPMLPVLKHLLCLGNQVSQRKIVDDILHLLDVIFDSVDLAAHNVVLEVEQLEARKQVLDEGADADGEADVAQGDGVHGQTAELVREVGQRQNVFLDGDVEGIAVLKVDRNCESGQLIPHVKKREDPTNLQESRRPPRCVANGRAVQASTRYQDRPARLSRA